MNMFDLSISSKFNSKNFLEILIKNISKKKLSSFKICFSLIYSIKSIQGARIHKQTGRYYELYLNESKLNPGSLALIVAELQIPRIGSYNMSCGPEGIFIIDEKNNLIVSSVGQLTFDKEIPLPIYPDKIATTPVPIIPEPKVLHLKNEFISCNNKYFINDILLSEIASTLEPICKTLEIDFNSQEGIKIQFQDKKLDLDEYELDIFKDHILISSSNYGGRLYALISLLHLAFSFKGNLPLGSIQDKPQFQWRGMHLDCSRQFHSIQQIKRLLNYMALFKLNRFHWHLSDNESWRLELNSFPNLAKQSSFRGYHEIIPPVYGSGYNRYGGYYSIKDVKDIIQYAKKLNIEVMPEIDLPAHSWALIQCIPGLIDKTSNQSFQDLGNYKDNTINPTLDDTWNFLEKAFEDISNSFPFSVIHIGVDERPKESWEGSPNIIEFMKKNKIELFEEVQDYFVNRIIHLLKNKNKRTAAWNEAAVTPYNKTGGSGGTGKIDKDCLIFAWEHPSVVQEVLERGFETVICQGQTCYFDMAYNNSTDERGLCWAATIETKDVHAWQPLNNISENYHSLVAGIQGQLWSETITDPIYFDQMINPRLATLAEVAWSSGKRRDWPNFKAALSQSTQLTKKLGWNSHNF